MIHNTPFPTDNIPVNLGADAYARLHVVRIVGMAEQRAITLDFLSKFVSKMAREKNLRMVVHYGLIH